MSISGNLEQNLRHGVCIRRDCTNYSYYSRMAKKGKAEALPDGGGGGGSGLRPGRPFILGRTMVGPSIRG
jgi:hypothetical protein